MKIFPIGIFTSELKEKYQAARQPGISQKERGVILLNRNENYEQALEDLEGFERIWIIFTFDRNHNWKPKVQPPRGNKKRGVFATRSPHRPNPIGISCVQLIRVEGRKVFIGSHDLLDQTPILDVKPYIPYADAFPNAKTGWLEDIDCETSYLVNWAPGADEQRLFLLDKGGPDLATAVQCRLESSPFPHPSHRIKQTKSGRFELAYKSWRIHYTVRDHHVHIESVFSGYRDFLGDDPYRDYALHKEFCHHFLNKKIEN